jgi:hypothetical protein
MAAGDNVDTMTTARQWRSVNVFYSGRTIYSYGTHFPMGYVLRPGVVWLNGDRYSNTTSKHQSELRAAVARAGLTAITVPGSALDGAGIDYRTIEPIAVERERFDYSEHVDDRPPAGMVTNPPAGRYQYVGTGDDYRSPSITFDDDGRAVWSQDGRPAANYVGYIETSGRRCAVLRDNSGRYVWHTVRHWLGDSVFTAVRSSRFGSPGGPRVYWVSSFDQQERRPLYFLSQLPAPADTVDSAIESLSPDSVRTARDMGRAVVRQGDMFAIETTTTTRALKRAGATITRRKVTVDYRLDARRNMHVRDGLRAIVDTMPPLPARLYWETSLSRGAFDALRAWHDDRITEWADTVIARYATADPAAAQWANLRTFYNVTSALGYSPRVWDRTRDVDGTALLGTAHTATEVATLPNGLQYARGCLYHEPGIIGDRRRADHARRPLPGRAWYLVARNTVPVETGPRV